MVTLAQIQEKEMYFAPKKYRTEDRKKIDLEELKAVPSWQCDGEIVLRRTPRARKEGQPEGVTYYDTKAYVPVVIGTDRYLWMTSSEPVVKLAYSIGIDEFPDEEHEGATLRICKDVLEGNLKIDFIDKEYGKKGKYPVPTIINA